MAEYVQNGADCLERLSCINVTETESEYLLLKKKEADWKMKCVYGSNWTWGCTRMKGDTIRIGLVVLTLQPYQGGSMCG